MRRLIVLLFFSVAVLAFVVDVHAAVAFPGAQGFGKDAVGGRGGEVIAVTNLNNAGPGSLREACEADGRRTVVFRVGGTIELRSPIEIKNPFITIAGQTAPGGGVLLKHAGNEGFVKGLVLIRTNNVIIRHLRFRRGPSAEGEDTGDCLFMGQKDSGSVHDVMIDSCSFSWSTDELVDVYYNSRNVTLQNCIFSEALEWSTHKEGNEYQPHSMAVFCAFSARNVTVYKSLFAHNRTRNPRFYSKTAGVKEFQFINNVIYNYHTGSVFASSSGGVNVDSVGNKYIAGEATDTDKREVFVGGGGKLFIHDNRSPHRWWSSQSQWLPVGDDPNSKYRSFSAFTDYSSFPLINSNSIAGSLLYKVGATRPARDSVDARVVQDVWDRTGEIIDDPKEVGGWPSIANGYAPKDRDDDGMPDWWEEQHSFNRFDSSDRNGDEDSDGYTNLEEFLNQTAPRRAD